MKQPVSIVMVLVFLSNLLSFQVSPKNLSNSAPVVEQVQILTPTVALNDRFEVQFVVTTSATNFDLPYESHPVPGLQSIAGISVDALLTSPTGISITQPAFWYQPYSHTVIDNQDHFTPQRAPLWALRFAPKEAGTWKLKIRVTDAGGTTLYPASDSLSFSVSGLSSNLFKRHGFLRVSQNDPRYFEFEDSTPFVGVGYNASFGTSTQVEQKMSAYQANKMNFFRIWLSSLGINGTQWFSWSSHHLASGDYLPPVSFDSQTTYQASDVSMKLNSQNPCLFDGWSQGPISVEPKTTYKIWARVKLENVSGPKASGDYGFVIKTGGWLGTDCELSTQGTPISSPVIGTTDWVEVNGTFTTNSGQYWLGNLYLTLQNSLTGSVYIDEVQLYRQDDPARINLLRRPFANSHLHFDPLNAEKMDLYLEAAENHGVYLKVVLDEKNEWIKNHLDASGKIVDSSDNNNFYAASNTKVRWLEQAWWRYVIARWGYSPAIHSFEFINEGDPYNSNHYEAANAMAVYFHQNDPSRHMVTTSFWASFPNKEFWSNPTYSSIDYADLHAYLSTGWGGNASFLSQFPPDTTPADILEGNASAYLSGNNPSEQSITPRGLVIQQKGEWIVRYWMKAEAYTASCEYGTTGGNQRVRWTIDGGPYWGGKTGIVPADKEGKDFTCTSPAGSYDWKQFQSDRDRNGLSVPTQYRLFITDDLPHEISLSIENLKSTGGSAWIDKVEIVSPTGQTVPVVGKFDVTPLGTDTAWYQNAYGSLLGADCPVGLKKPLVRGEGGIDKDGVWDADLLKDVDGIWLHDDLWAQTASGGIPDLMWWASQTIDADSSSGHKDIYKNYLAFKNFMEGIPLNNGFYKDARASTSNINLRVWGQRDSVHGKTFLWIQNKQHNWRTVVDAQAVTPVSGSITLPDIPSGKYRIQWWDTYSTTNSILYSQEIFANGTLVFSLPYALTKDIAVKIDFLSSTSQGEHSIMIPFVVR